MIEKKIVTAKLNNAPISCRKINLSADLIRGKGIMQAKQILKLTPKKSCRIMLKLLNSAIANANQKLAEEIDIVKDFKIVQVDVGRGRYLNRFHPRAKGAAFPIRKHFSNVTIRIGTWEKR